VVWIDRSGEPVPIDLSADGVLHFGEDEADATPVERLVEVLEHVCGGGVHVGDGLVGHDDP
jgi:hypothetical protein